DAEERRKLVEGKVEPEAGAGRVFHFLDAQIDKGAERMIDDAALEADLLAVLGHRLEFRFGRMAEKDRRVVVVGHAEDLFDLRQKPSLVIEQIVAVLERV